MLRTQSIAYHFLQWQRKHRRVEGAPGLQDNASKRGHEHERPSAVVVREAPHGRVQQELRSPNRGRPCGKNLHHAGRIVLDKLLQEGGAGRERKERQRNVGHHVKVEKPKLGLLSRRRVLLAVSARHRQCRPRRKAAGAENNKKRQKKDQPRDGTARPVPRHTHSCFSTIFLFFSLSFLFHIIIIYCCCCVSLYYIIIIYINGNIRIIKCINY